MLAWEQFLTGDPAAASPARHFVVSSWLRSRDFGIDPCARAAPLAAQGQAIDELRDHNRNLVTAANLVLAAAPDLMAGSRSIMVLTDPEGVVLSATGDTQTLDQGQAIHLTEGGAWGEDLIGTNGIGTALATRRPAQVHAAEHFCEGVKSWTCAAAPILAPGSASVLGVIDISGPPSTYQRTNLSLAVATARQIEMVLLDRARRERTLLLEACLDRISATDSTGLLAIDRQGRLIHRSGCAPVPLRLGDALPGLDANLPVEQWPERLPEALRGCWFDPVTIDGRTIGAMLVVPGRPRGGSAVPQRATAHHSEADPRRSSFMPIIGRSPQMLEAIARARQLADKRVAVLIEGETGVGKELFARAMHGDQAAPFIAFNCGAISRELIAGELFGHVRGAFTGATSEGRPGRFELANGGTLCLDEIGELPMDLQPLLLRVLEEGVVYRLGDSQPRRIDVRLLALTNRNLGDEAAAGRFRRDLYYRINVTRVRIPPLRERAGDVGLLVEHFNHVLALRHAVPRRRFGPEVLSRLARAAWPGNVRELRNLVEGLLLVAPAAEVSQDEVAATLPGADCDRAAEPYAGSLRAPLAAGISLQATESAAIAQAVHDTRGNFAGAARSLGISRSTLYRKAARYGISVAAAGHDSGAGRSAKK